MAKSEPDATDGRRAGHHRSAAEHRPVLRPVRCAHGGGRGRSVHGDQQRGWDLRGGRQGARHPSDQRRAADGDAVRGRLAGEGAGPSQERSRCRALPGRGQARLHGALDHLHQAAVERVGTARRAHPHQEPEGDGRDRDVHGRRRATLPQRDLLDRHGRRPPLRAPGRPRGPQAHHGHRRRLGGLLHRGCQGAPRHPRRGARPARGVRDRARVHRRERRCRPRRGSSRATSRAIRSRPTAMSPSWPPTCPCTAAR